jgi:hypothetical protein
MRWLIRTVHRKGKGQLSYEDDIHFGDVLTIGRGASQAVFLTDMRAALEHARVTSVGRGSYRLESMIDAGVRVNGGIVHEATLAPGAQIEIGATRIELLEPPEDYDAGVEISSIELAEQEATAVRKRLPVTLAETRLSKRWPGWLLLVSILLLGLLLPLAAHYSSALSAALVASPLPSRDAWLAGELAPAHHFFGSDCNACHSEAFRWVKDGDCQRCHADTPAHADPVAFNLPALGEARCAHCHRDHNGPDGLVRADQALCADCHSGLDTRTAGASSLAAIGDFGNAHPEFKVALPAWDADGRFLPRRTELAPGLEERSGLKFPHELHLRAEGLAAPDGRRRLDCGDCHREQAGGALMQPVDFGSMCQDCHRLTFDITAPERQVPHARIAEIFFMLDEFYARRALEGEVADAAAPPTLRTRRRPGQQITTEERQLALTWARDKSRQVGESLFTGRACTVCHAVSPGPDPAEPWRVAPVRVAGEWFTKARFTHRRHRTMACVDCHDARASTTSSDLLLPGIANCRQCHAGDDGGRDRLKSGCIACHGYHESPHLLQRDL